MAKEIIMFDIDELGIDTLNIRAGEWDYDEEFVEDVRNNGIINPLLVRPAEGDKYAIVCGSRRYNAAIEAGLTQVPCMIQEMDDVTAIGRTISENTHKRETPSWQYALKIGEMYELLNHTGKKADVLKIITNQTGFSVETIQRYLDIAGLPGEIIELMKDPTKRSEVVKELLKGMPAADTEKMLSVDKAVKIASELRDIPKGKMFEVAAYVIGVSKDLAFDIIKKVKTYPKKSMEELHEMVEAIPKGARWMFEFSSSIIMALDEACMRRKIDRKSLVVRYVQDGLRKDGFL